MRNHKGFSLIEILGVVLITSAIIVPLLIGLILNVDVNTRMLNRSAASLVAVSAIQGFQSMTFVDLEDTLGDDDFIALEAASCHDGTLAGRTNTKDTCEYAFSLSLGNIIFRDEDYRIFLYTSDVDLENLTLDIPNQDAVLVHMQRHLDESPSGDIIHMTVWVRFDYSPLGTLYRTGILTADRR